MLTLPHDIICGYYDSRENGDMLVSSKRTVTKFEIEFFLEDGSSTFADDTEHAIKKYYIRIAYPGQVVYSHYHFKTMYLKFSAENEIAEKLLIAPAYFSSSHPERIMEKLDKIILLNESGENELLLQSQLLSFLNLVLVDSGIPQPQSGGCYEIVARAKRFIEDKFADPITLIDIADAVNLSRTYFHNTFTAACGMSPHRYLIHCRISEAKRQLWNSAIPLSVIAENCGFGCQQYFSKIFKKETGTTPKQYRKEIQKKYSET